MNEMQQKTELPPNMLKMQLMMARRLIPHGPHTASFNWTSKKWFQPLYFSFQSAIILDPEKTKGRMKSRGFDCGWID